MYTDQKTIWKILHTRYTMPSRKVVSEEQLANITSIFPFHKRAFLLTLVLNHWHKKYPNTCWDYFADSTQSTWEKKMDMNVGAAGCQQDRLYCSWWMKNSLQPRGVSVNPIIKMRIQPVVAPCVENQSIVSLSQACPLMNQKKLMLQELVTQCEQALTNWKCYEKIWP